MQENPDHAGAWHLSGLVHRERGDLPRALECIERALSYSQHKAVYHNNYGVVLRDSKRFEDAGNAFRRALAIRPDYVDARSNLGLCRRDLNDYEAALADFEEALRLNPRHADAGLHLADCCRMMQRLTEAEQHYRHIIELVPNHVRAWIGLGRMCLMDRRPSYAVAALERAVALEPDHAEAHLSLGVAYAEEGRVKASAAAIGRACDLRPDRVSWRFRTLSICPAVFSDEEALNDYRRELDARLDAALEMSWEFDWKNCTTDGFGPPFELSHHGRCNRATKEKFARLFAPHFPQRRPELRETDRPRIGFLVTTGREAGFLRNMEHIVPRLDAQRFEPIVVCPAGGLARCRGVIRAPHVQWVAFPPDFADAVQCIRDAQIDILYHRQVGTDALNYFLPFARPAPVQCTGWGTHGTTGQAWMDYYLSSRLIELDGAAEHYTERLYRFETFPTCQSRVPPAEPATREDFGLPGSGALYFCPQRIQKLHPHFDRLLHGVLDADPSGTIAVLEGRHRHALHLLQQRFRRTLGETLMRRIRFLPSMGPRDYYRVLSLADVVLDAPHYSASLTGFDAFSLGVPVVTQPGTYNVERYALGLYRRMGIQEFVAHSPGQYVDLAVRTGTDLEYRRHWHQQILQRGEILFEDQTAIREHEDFFAYCWEHRWELQAS